MATRWDPEQYLRYGDERGRPFTELLARVGHPHPKRVVDLGCGPGTTTSQLLDRWPDAHVLGVDNSEEMISHARAVEVPGRLEFRLGDLREWKPAGPVDLILCCATLQWVPDHVELFPRLIDSLSPEGVFAFQVPANFDQPSHTLLHELATSQRWTDLLGHLVRPDPVLQPSAYLSALMEACAAADVWSTTYLHVLHGPDAVLEWVRGTALRPYLSALEAEDGGAAAEFVSAYSASLRAAYPRDARGMTIFPFRRIFAVAAPLREEPGNAP
jgi:trans-aconitate 2-methyltransferase